MRRRSRISHDHTITGTRRIRRGRAGPTADARDSATTPRPQGPAAFDVDAPFPPRTDESSSLPAATAARQGYLVTFDSSGPWPALCVSDRIGGATVALSGRRNPVLDAERAL